MAHRTHRTRISKNVLCRTGVQSIGVIMKNERHYAQRHSKVSEWTVKNSQWSYPEDYKNLAISFKSRRLPG